GRPLRGAAVEVLIVANRLQPFAEVLTAHQRLQVGVFRERLQPAAREKAARERAVEQLHCRLAARLLAGGPVLGGEIPVGRDGRRAEGMDLAQPEERRWGEVEAGESGGLGDRFTVFGCAGEGFGAEGAVASSALRDWFQCDDAVPVVGSL